MSSLPSATSLPSWRVTAYTWKLLHSSLSFLLFFVPFLLHLSEHEVTKIRLYIQNKKGPIIVYLFSLFPRKVHFKTRWYKICQDPWKASLILLFLLTLNQFCRTISLDPIDLALFPINFKVKFSLTLAGPLLQHLSCIIVNPKHPASVMPSTLKLKYTKTWKVIRVTPKIAVLPFSSRYDLVLQWLPGVSLDNPWLWEVFLGSFPHFGLCSRHQNWLQHELQLPGSQISGVTAGAGLASKVIAQRHRFHKISSLTTAEDHIYWFSSLTAHPVAPCVVSFGFRVWSVTLCVWPMSLLPLCWSTCPSSLPASCWESHGLFWAD